MEFHAVICCGLGVNLNPFTKVRESGISKALLPIGNKPMIEYVLEWCDQAPFNGITVVADSAETGEISKAVNLYKKKRSKDVETLSPIDTLDFDDESTGGILSQLVLTGKNYVLLPCDAITNLPPQVLIEEYRNRNETDIAMSVHYHNKFESIDKNNLTHYYTVYSDDEHLLDVYSKDSVELSKFLELRSQMIWRYPHTNVSTKLLDSFIYFFSHESLEILTEELSDHKTKSITKIVRDLARRSWRHSKPKGTIRLFVLPEQADFIRADNVPAYLEANRYIMRMKVRDSPQLHQQQQQQPKEKGAATVGIDSLVGSTTVLGERTSVKKTVVGDGCKIGKRCRLTGCVLLNDITLEDDVILENCIIGSRVTVHNKSKLTNCNVEAGYVVSKNSAIKGETLTDLYFQGDFDEVSDDSEYDSNDEIHDVDHDAGYEDDGLFGH